MAKIRVLSALLLSGALAVTASGCASQSSGASDSLTYWSMWKEGEAQQKVVAAAIADFEDETGITVNVQWQGRDNVKKVVPTLNTNKTPDLIDGSFAKLAPILAETNQAAPLTKAYDAEVDGKKVSDLIPSAYLKAGELTLEGADAPWMLPYSLTSDAVWFNAAEHPELVEKAPATWDEFIDTLDELQAKGETPIGIDGDVSGYNAYWYTTLMMRLDGPGSLKKMAADESGAPGSPPMRSRPRRWSASSRPATISSTGTTRANGPRSSKRGPTTRPRSCSTEHGSDRDRPVRRRRLRILVVPVPAGRRRPYGPARRLRRVRRSR